MSNQPTDPQGATAIVQIGRYIISRSAQSHFFLATIAGMCAADRGAFRISTGGFGLLQYLQRDQTVNYSPHGFSTEVIRRHACNIWFNNEELDARIDRWVIDVFNQESEEKLTVLRDELVQIGEGQVEFYLKCRRGPIRPEKHLSDYGLGIRK
jgi:hypothetical protein